MAERIEVAVSCREREAAPVSVARLDLTEHLQFEMQAVQHPADLLRDLSATRPQEVGQVDRTRLASLGERAAAAGLDHSRDERAVRSSLEQEELAEPEPTAADPPPPAAEARAHRARETGPGRDLRQRRDRTARAPS